MTPLFDPCALSFAQARARRLGGDAFLRRHAAEEVAARLSAVQRRFETVVIEGGENVAHLLPEGRALDRLAFAGERLPLPPASVDLYIALIDIGAANDLPGALIQIARALRPDGLFLGVLLGGRTLVELRESFAAAEAELLGGARPHVAPMADIRDCGGLLQRAGFALPVADADVLSVRYASPRALMHDLRAQGLTNALAERSRQPMRRSVLARAEAIYSERFGLAHGRVAATFELIVLTGWAAHASQQQPARRGSGTVSLAEVLKPG